MPLYTCSKHPTKPVVGCEVCVSAAANTRLSSNQQLLMTKGLWRCGCDSLLPGANIRKATEAKCRGCDRKRPSVRTEELKEPLEKKALGWIDPRQLDMFPRG